MKIEKAKTANEEVEVTQTKVTAIELARRTSKQKLQRLKRLAVHIAVK